MDRHSILEQFFAYACIFSWTVKHTNSYSLKVSRLILQLKYISGILHTAIIASPKTNMGNKSNFKSRLTSHKGLQKRYSFIVWTFPFDPLRVVHNEISERSPQVACKTIHLDPASPFRHILSTCGFGMLKPYKSLRKIDVLYSLHIYSKCLQWICFIKSILQRFICLTITPQIPQSTPICDN